jgi:hypothetical protein
VTPISWAIAVAVLWLVLVTTGSTALIGVTPIGPLFIDLGFALIIVTSLLFIPFVEFRLAKY